MSKLLALDIGKVRIGLAMCNAINAIPEPFCILERAGKRAEKEILELIEKHKIQTVVVGLPLDEKDRETDEANSIRKYMARIQRRANIEIVYVDEYASSEEAAEALRHKKGRKKGMLDSAAASIILQRYLDSLK